MPTTGKIVAGRYLIVRRLGGGGMKEVYEARDTRLANRRCALAQIKDVFSDPSSRKQATEAFEREAQILAGLENEHIPRVFDAFSDSSLHYLVMDLVEGKTVEEMLIASGGKLPQQGVIAIALQILETLEYLHGLKPPIIYRDLKPSNVMVTSKGQVKLVDFGIARHFQPTTTVTAIGTQGYAPPEQYRGKIDPRADLYALAATMHQMLTGRDPATEPPFSFPTLRSLKPDCSEEFENLISDGLKYDVQNRVRSASDFELRLRLVRDSLSLAGSVGPAKSDSSRHSDITVPLAKPRIDSLVHLSLRFKTAIIGLLGMLVLGTLFIWFATSQNTTPGVPDLVATPEAGGAAPTVTSVPSPVADALSDLEKETRDRPDDPNAWARLGSALAYKARDDEASYLKALDAFAEALKLDPNSVEALKGLGDMHYHRGEYQKAAPLYDRYLRKTDDPVVRNHFAFSLLKTRNFTRAASEFKKVVDTHPSFSTYWGLGFAYYKINDDFRSRAALREALSLAPNDTYRDRIQSLLTNVDAEIAERELQTPEARTTEEEPKTPSRLTRETGRSRARYFTIGSTKAEVLAIQGTPTEINFGGLWWSYGYSCHVYFDTAGRVTEYSNNCGELHVRLK
jgi:serine/threonine protein kinase